MADSPPTLPTTYHARLTGQRAGMGGRVTLTLYGSFDKPSLYADTPDAFSGVTVRPRRDELVRFAREVLSFLGEDNGVRLTPWKPYNNGAGKRPWFLARSGPDSDSIPLEDRYHYNAAGNLVRYASIESAQRAADKLNKQENDGYTPDQI
jgi:hypothetical protein